MFSDVIHLQSLFTSSWPAVDLGDLGTETGNNGLDWNYGQNFGGPLKATWASGADTVHSGGVGMFGTMGVNYPGTVGLGSQLDCHPEDQYPDGNGGMYCYD